MRPLIVHYHLFKNAGTSVEAVLKDNLGSGWVSHDSDNPAGSVFAEDIERIAVADSQITAISSHQLRPPMPLIDGMVVVPIVFLRHPLDRLQSVYDFDRRRGPITPAGELAAAHEFDEYVDVLLEQNAIHANNFQVRTLTDEWDPATGRRLTRSDHQAFERAAAFIRSLPAVGIVERYDESWLGFAALVRMLFPTFAVAPAHTNADPSRPVTLEARLDRLCDRLGEARLERLTEANKFDLCLYQAAIDRFELRNGSPT